MNGGGVQVETVSTVENGRSDHKSSHKSSHKHKHKHKDRDRDRDRDRDKDRERDKHRSSHKDKHRDRHSHGTSKDKHSRDHHSSRDGHKSHSHRSDGKHRDHSSGKENGDAHKQKHPKEHKHRHSAGEALSPVVVKTEPDNSFDSRRMSEDFQVFPSKPVKREVDSGDQDAASDEGGGNHLVVDTSRCSDASPAPTPSHEDEESEEDVPLSMRKKPHVNKEKRTSSSSVKSRAPFSDESEEDIPLSARKSKPNKMKRSLSDDEFETKPSSAKKVKKESAKRKSTSELQVSPVKKAKKEEEQEVWKWWEEEKSDPSVKWTTLEHKGPLLAPEYEPLPASVKFYYDGAEMRLSEPAEEVATFYSKMLDHDYTTKEVFNKNFFHDWRKFMTDKERHTITALDKCDFTKMAAYFKMKTEEKKAMTKEEKKAIKLKNEEIVKEYGFCTLDGHKEKIGNFRVEPPGLFRGRGEHPKQGMVKRRLVAKDIVINCGKGSKVPEPPPGQRWKKVQHDNTVTWLACWKENIQGQIKYVMLNAASRLKGEKDWGKYETARRLHKCVDKIRQAYRDDFKSKEMRVRQRAVAMYFIDKLALRAGNEKDEDQADTVGCCSLRVEHIKLHEQLNGKEYVVVFDFLGKDSIRYYNEVSVEKRVFKNLTLFTENKEPNDDLFDRLNTTILNKHLNEQMEGLSAKVFRTYNASNTLQHQLDELTKEDMTVNEKILAYNRANRAVAILCNHQRAVPKTFDKSMENLKGKIADKREQLAEAERQYKSAKKAAKNSMKERSEAEKKKKAVERISDQLKKLELSATDKEENKDIALGTSKLNYLDPRISVAWCKKWEVPIEKVYNKTQREKFRWAIDMAGPEFEF